MEFRSDQAVTCAPARIVRYQQVGWQQRLWRCAWARRFYWFSTLLRLRCWKRGFVKNVWDPLGLTTPDNLAPAPTGANRLVNTDPPDLYSQGGQGTYGGQGGGYGHVLLVPLLAATERSLLNLCHIHRKKSTLARSITITTIPPVMTKRVATSTSGSCYF